MGLFNFGKNDLDKAFANIDKAKQAKQAGVQEETAIEKPMNASSLKENPKSTAERWKDLEAIDEDDEDEKVLNDKLAKSN